MIREEDATQRDFSLYLDSILVVKSLSDSLN